MLRRVAGFIKQFDLDTKLTALGILLLVVTWILGLVQDPTVNEVFLILLGLLVLTFFLLTTSEGLRREQRLVKVIRNDLVAYFIQRIKLKDEIEDSGLLSVRLGRDYNYLAQLILSTNRSLDILGITLYAPLFTLRQSLIESLSKNNYDVRVLISTSDSPGLLTKEQEENNSGRLQNEVGAALNLLNEIVGEARLAGYKGKVEVARYEGATYCSLYIIDSRIIIYNPYLYFVRGVELPVFEIENKPNGLSRVYFRHFQKTWENAKTKSQIA